MRKMVARWSIAVAMASLAGLSAAQAQDLRVEVEMLRAQNHELRINLAHAELQRAELTKANDALRGTLVQLKRAWLAGDESAIERLLEGVEDVVDPDASASEFNAVLEISKIETLEAPFELTEQKHELIATIADRQGELALLQDEIEEMRRANRERGYERIRVNDKTKTRRRAQPYTDERISLKARDATLLEGDIARMEREVEQIERRILEGVIRVSGTSLVDTQRIDVDFVGPVARRLQAGAGVGDAIGVVGRIREADSSRLLIDAQSFDVLEAQEIEALRDRATQSTTR